MAPFCSHSFSPHSLSKVSPLYWVVQKQNHKPISVTLAMRLDGPNLSPSGAIGSTPVSLKRPLSFQTEKGAFCLLTIAIELLKFMWLIRNEVRRCISGAWLHLVRTNCVIMRGDVCILTIKRTSSAFTWSFEMIPNDLCEEKAHRRACLSQKSHSMVLKTLSLLIFWLWTHLLQACCPLEGKKDNSTHVPGVN